MRKSRLKELKWYLKNVRKVDLDSPEGKKYYKLLKKEIANKGIK